MPFIYRNLILSPHDGEDRLPALVAGQLGVPRAALCDLRILRKGIDARRKPRIKLIYTVSFSLVDDAPLLARLTHEPDLEWQPEPAPALFPPVRSPQRIVIVGSGPAGLFAALRLAEYGLTATLIERGQPVEQRSLDVQKFWKTGLLDPESNVQFGEGGAGTFSDGKLTCRSKDPLGAWVLEQMAGFGAPPEIRYLAKPHIGTDRLRTVVSAMRLHLLEKGFAIRFGCRLTDIVTARGAVSSIVVNDGEELPCDLLVLASGHSARDTYEMLERRNVPLERKAFAMGLRVEHPQALIDRIQYGGPRHPSLPAADYAVTWNNSATGRSAYSFCMCPGGVVIGGASEEGGVVTNGMSGQMRDTPFANSALVVNVAPEDFGGPDPLAGVRFQRHWEHQAFLAGGGGYHAPASNLMGFMGLPGKGRLSSSYRPGIVEADLDTVLPRFITQTLREGINEFGRKLRGFVTAEAVLVGIESRTSAPVRIPRNEHYESVGLAGLYPVGEGAGYAGGIMSSAIDGIRIADTIAARLGETGK
ncbi:NAD(P)/FAD-dependent oxidoreductase [Oryzomonas rubra]|uniref:FAD-binding protein n=1 Tax=Oryzomonas rubra TaxID=2509454 RepID=A0A5A9XGK2_9BACT|nr:FAD-binding protein [Oryzomonas rubra]KAA0891428.1 FAD-binding protein [Oryzomonas rubra]